MTDRTTNYRQCSIVGLAVGLAAVLAIGCGGGATANETEPGDSSGGGGGDGDTPATPTEASSDGAVTDGGDDTGPVPPEERQEGGRTPRRLSVDQVRTTLAELLGQTYRGGANVFDPLEAEGEVWRDDADLLDVFAGAMGRPDYNYTVVEGLEAGMTFAKFVQDAARSTCRLAVEADVTAAPESRHVLLYVEADDTLASAESGVRETIAALALRFWARDLEPASPEVDELIEVFNAAATAPEWLDETEATRPAGTPLDGWRAVCIALVADGQFYVY